MQRRSRDRGRPWPRHRALGPAPVHRRGHRPWRAGAAVSWLLPAVSRVVGPGGGAGRAW